MVTWGPLHQSLSFHPRTFLVLLSCCLMDSADSLVSYFQLILHRLTFLLWVRRMLERYQIALCWSICHLLPHRWSPARRTKMSRSTSATPRAARRNSKGHPPWPRIRTLRCPVGVSLEFPLLRRVNLSKSAALVHSPSARAEETDCWIIAIGRKSDGSVYEVPPPPRSLPWVQRSNGEEDALEHSSSQSELQMSDDSTGNRKASFATSERLMSCSYDERSMDSSMSISMMSCPPCTSHDDHTTLDKNCNAFSRSSRSRHSADQYLPMSIPSQSKVSVSLTFLEHTPHVSLYTWKKCASKLFTGMEQFKRKSIFCLNSFGTGTFGTVPQLKEIKFQAKFHKIKRSVY